MREKNTDLNTKCVHEGELPIDQYKSAVSPLYFSTAFDYQDQHLDQYPRYFNTPNQIGLNQKIAALDHCESGLVFASGMAAITSTLLGLLSAGDHMVIQNSIYGGTYNFVANHLKDFGIQHDFTAGLNADDFAQKIKPNTKIIYIESPSNPLLEIVDFKAIVARAHQSNILVIIDSTMGSPVNQLPAQYGVDVIIHSATKYMSGHSDILAGTIACSKALKDRIAKRAKMLGGNLSDLTVWLLDRSIKTMGLRVDAQNKNAMIMATWLEAQPQVDRVFYPGLTSHPDHVLAQSQMCGFGGVVSFELSKNLSAVSFLNHLKLIKRASSFAGVESTALIPALTSHSLLTSEQRAALGISDQLIRFSVGIESAEELQNDIAQAF
ncbi:MAG: aminotransferase class V-fold PLP-dependent enzyme [Bacteroidetes bacterium]|nr:aminotransferase class V-fold PLP-dependent enzyme [Flavobacteriaceae bacterium]MDA1210718.1 aminotransferase class V-fold PLP-dependent enzyme [Bacteroidota bacterium]